MESNNFSRQKIASCDFLHRHNQWLQTVLNGRFNQMSFIIIRIGVERPLAMQTCVEVSFWLIRLNFQ